MIDFLLQILVIILLIGIATYDTLQSKRLGTEDSPFEAGEIADLQS